MTQESSHNDKEIARGVRETMHELGASREEMAVRMRYPPNRVFGLTWGLKHWTRKDKEKFVVDLGLLEGKARDTTAKSVWERIEGLTDEELDELLRRDPPRH